MKKMTDYKPYAELKEKHDELKGQLKPLLTGDKPEALRAKAAILDSSIEAEAEALLDPKKQKEANAAREEAKRLREEAKNRDRQIKVLQRAIEKLDPDLRQAAEKAFQGVIKDVRPKHEKAVAKIVDLQKQLNQALLEEQEICQELRSEVGSDAALVPVYKMLGSKNKFGKVQPGFDDDQNSLFYEIINKLREFGYNV